MGAFEGVKLKSKKEDLKKSKEGKKGALNALNEEQKDTFFFIGHRMKALLKGLSGKAEKDEEGEEKSSDAKEYIANASSFQELCLKNSKQLKDIGLSLRPAYLRNRLKKQEVNDKGEKDVEGENDIGFMGGVSSFTKDFDWGELISGTLGAFGVGEGVSSLINLGLSSLFGGVKNLNESLNQKKEKNESLIDEMDDISFADENEGEIESKEKVAAKVGFEILHKKLFTEGKSIKEVNKEVDSEIIPEIRYEFAMERLQNEDVDVNDDNKILVKEQASMAAQETVKSKAAEIIDNIINSKKKRYPEFAEDEEKQKEALEAAEGKVDIETLLNKADELAEKVINENPSLNSKEIIEKVTQSVREEIVKNINVNEIKQAIDQVAKSQNTSQTSTKTTS